MVSTADCYILPCCLYYIIGLEIKKKIRPLETNYTLWTAGREQKRLEVAPLSGIFAMTINKLGEAHSSSFSKRLLLFTSENS